MNIRPEKLVLFIAIAFLLITKVSHADNINSFVDNLNSNWVNTNYVVCLSNINARLAIDSNDLPALVAKSCYFVFVDADFSSATNIFETTDTLTNSLSGTNISTITKLYEGLRDDIKACLSVPMTNQPPEEQKQYVRDTLYPTNYPEQHLIRLLGNP